MNEICKVKRKINIETFEYEKVDDNMVIIVDPTDNEGVMLSGSDAVEFIAFIDRFFKKVITEECEIES